AIAVVRNGRELRYPFRDDVGFDASVARRPARAERCDLEILINRSDRDDILCAGHEPHRSERAIRRVMNDLAVSRSSRTRWSRTVGAGAVLRIAEDFAGENFPRDLV